MTAQLQTFLLIFIRIATFVFVCPGFSLKGMPNFMKVALSLGISLPVFSLQTAIGGELGMFALIFLIVKEALVGLAIGYIAQLFFAAIEMAGSFADVQVGFSMSQLFDPSIGINASFLGKVYYWISLAVFFLTDIHHRVIETLVGSFQQLPVQSLLFNPVDGILHLFTLVFGTAFRLAAPLMIVALLTEILLGVLSRTVPQINVLILSMPLKVLIVLIFLLAFFPTLYRNIADLMPQMLQYMNEFIYSFSQR
ncbi:flagellar biosynthetic protein FliR [Jeotgalibaca sp. YN-L-12]|nr:flagellar biosynthetic protein FliR [Jeotgalibaca caeni]MDE1548269.1 flagellar biosynthetic protein FliR [Jeotgalibaca caeni]